MSQFWLCAFTVYLAFAMIATELGRDQVASDSSELKSWLWTCANQQTPLIASQLHLSIKVLPCMAPILSLESFQPPSMAMRRVSTIFRSPSASHAGPSSEKSPATVVEDDSESVNTEIADVKSQQTTVTVLPVPLLKIKVRPREFVYFAS